MPAPSRRIASRERPNRRATEILTASVSPTDHPPSRASSPAEEQARRVALCGSAGSMRPALLLATSPGNLDAKTGDEIHELFSSSLEPRAAVPR